MSFDSQLWQCLWYWYIEKVKRISNALRSVIVFILCSQKIDVINRFNFWRPHDSRMKIHTKLTLLWEKIIKKEESIYEMNLILIPIIIKVMKKVWDWLIQFNFHEACLKCLYKEEQIETVTNRQEIQESLQCS